MLTAPEIAALLEILGRDYRPLSRAEQGAVIGIVQKLEALMQHLTQPPECNDDACSKHDSPTR